MENDVAKIFAYIQRNKLEYSAKIIKFAWKRFSVEYGADWLAVSDETLSRFARWLVDHYDDGSVNV